jgi:hypothetical protein
VIRLSLDISERNGIPKISELGLNGRLIAPVSQTTGLSTDQSASVVILTTIAIDPTTGVVALAWGDTRGSLTNQEVNHYGVFLDPRELN